MESRGMEKDKHSGASQMVNNISETYSIVPVVFSLSYFALFFILWIWGLGMSRSAESSYCLLVSASCSSKTIYAGWRVILVQTNHL